MDEGEIVRIWNDEYGGIPHNSFFTHFVLPPTTVVPGKRYALPRILKHGYFDVIHQKEIPPELSYENIFVGECFDVKDISYESITKKDFEYSLRHIQDVESLKKFMLRRYGASRPDLTSEAIVSRGVSKITLHISK